MKRLEVDREKLSPGMKQYMDIKDQYSEEMLFFRLGDFYELFFEDAIICSRELELTLTLVMVKTGLKFYRDYQIIKKVELSTESLLVTFYEKWFDS